MVIKKGISDGSLPAPSNLGMMPILMSISERKTLQVHLVYGDVNHLLPLSGSYHIKEYTLSTYRTKLTCRKVMPMASSPAKKETLLILNNQNGKTRLPDCYKIVGKV
jgi:hypothetical protein